MFNGFIVPHITTAEAQQTDPPLINNHKSKLRTLVESSRPSTKINNHVCHINNYQLYYNYDFSI